jgi:hypothetical protein
MEEMATNIREPWKYEQNNRNAVGFFIQYFSSVNYKRKLRSFSDPILQADLTTVDIDIALNPPGSDNCYLRPS